MIDAIRNYVMELWGTLTGMWAWFSDVMAGFADIGMSHMADVIAQYGGSAEPTALTSLIGGLYIVATIVPGLALSYFVLKSIFRDRRKAAGGALVWKLGGIGVTGYLLDLRPTPTQVYGRISQGPVVIAEALSGFVAQADHIAIATTFGMFIIFFGLAWGMFYSINLLTYFLGILIRPNPPWSESSGRGHALLYTILWIFFMTSPTMSAAMAFVNVMIVNAVILWRRAEWRDSLRSSGVEITPEAIADAIAEGNQESSGDDVPSGTDRIDYRRK